MTNIKTTVIHHRADFDGLFCREIARKFLPEAELIGWDYGDPLMEFPTSGMVYVMDLSPDCFNPGLGFHNGMNRLIWIDHHKTAIEKWPQLIPGYRIDGVAACRLAWQWFTVINEAEAPAPPLGLRRGLPQKQDFIDRSVPEPYAVRLAGEYDIWDKRDPDAELFQHGLRSCNLDDRWLRLLGNDGMDAKICVNTLLNKGEAIQYSKAKENEGIITSLGFTIHWEGFCLLACNAARYNSQLFKAGLQPEHDGCLGFNWDGKNKEWRVSLYSDKPGVDMSPVAKKYGGGGHAGACGFRCRTLPFFAGSDGMS